MPWLAVATIAANILGNISKDKAANKQRSNNIETEALRNKAAILQGGRDVGDYKFAGAKPEEHGDSGIGSILQLASTALGKGGGAAAVPAAGGGGAGGGGGINDAIDALGSSTNRLTEPSLIGEGDDWHPLSDDSSVGDPDKWKSNATLGGYDPEDRWKKGLRL